MDLDATRAMKDLYQEVVKELGRDYNGGNVGGLHGEKADDLYEEMVTAAKETEDQVREFDLNVSCSIGDPVSLYERLAINTRVCGVVLTFD
jgi:hypothetical protein